MLKKSVTALFYSRSREYYAKYGQHLNNLGKAKVSKQLSLQLLSVLQ